MGRYYTQYENNQITELLKRSVAIANIATDMGYTLVKKSPRYYSLQEHDSVIIDTKKNCFYRNSDPDKSARGSVIDFVKYFNQCSIAEAYEYLYNIVGGKENLAESLCIDYSKERPESKLQQQRKIEKAAAQTELELPAAGSTYRNVYAYLLKERKIDKSIVQEFVEKKMLYQDERNNCVFVSRNETGAPVFVCKRGTNTYKRFVQDLPGSDYSKGFYINNTADKLFIAESVIDAMSYMSLLKQSGKEFHDYNYLILASATKLDPIKNWDVFKEYICPDVYIGLDNDSAGENSRNLIKDILKDKEVRIHDEISVMKDWNEDLKNNIQLNLSTTKENPIRDIQKKKTENKIISHAINTRRSVEECFEL